MSAAATAAGYLYASGRLRGRGAREQEQEHSQPQKPKPAGRETGREKIRVAVVASPDEPNPRREPKNEYPTRRRRTAAIARARAARCGPRWHIGRNPLHDAHNAVRKECWS